MFFRYLFLFLTLLTPFIAAEPPFVTCLFRGQLGNQMWQIAAVIGYALEHDYRPIFPFLHHAINGSFNAHHFFHRLDTRFPPKISFHHYVESHSHLYTPIPDYQGVPLCLNGHFESPKYFEKYSDVIRDLFAPTEEILTKIREQYGTLLSQGPLVAVHVRTYIPDHHVHELGGATWRYFTTAMDLFPPDSHFVVFSDDIEWTKQHFPKEHRRVSFIEGHSYEIDFYLMSLCDHVIVSPESTFSWWAAWLNANPNKRVVVADVWGDQIDNDTIPENWTKIPKTGLP